MPLTPLLERQRQVDLLEFEASLVYRVSSRTARAVTQRNSISKNKTGGRGNKTAELKYSTLLYFLVIIWGLSVYVWRGLLTHPRSYEGQRLTSQMSSLSLSLSLFLSLSVFISLVFFLIYLFIMHTIFCLCVCRQARRGHQTSLQMVVSQHVGAGN